MAAYPSYYMQRAGTREIRRGGHRAMRATNGALHVQRLFSGTKREFEVEHWLSSADKAAFESFYTSNRDLNVDLTWPENGAVYTVRFVDEPQYLLRDGAFWVVRVRLAEV